MIVVIVLWYYRVKCGKEYGAKCVLVFVTHSLLNC
jgi:hypothetical protein